MSKSYFIFSFVCLSVYLSESGAVNIRGENITVGQDQQVEFQCDTTAWYPEPTVSWVVNGVDVDSNQYNTTSVTDGNFYNSTSVLNFQAVSSGTVECRATIAALRNPISSSVSLTVGKQIEHGALNVTELKPIWPVHTTCFKDEVCRFVEVTSRQLSFH